MTVLDRTLPRFGGFSLGMIGLELRRMLRNKRTIIFTLVMPAAFFLLFGSSAEYRTERVGDGNVTGYVLVSMAVYGAMLATTSGGAMVSIERAAGWSRQLRLTPLKPLAYVAVKLLLAMIIGAVSVAVAFAVGAVGGAELPLRAWIGCGLLAWLCSLVFAAFGLFMGYLLPSENVMQILGPALAVLSFAGGLFVPVDQLGSTFATIATFTPVYGVGEIARYPLVQDGDLWVAALNVIVWTALFSAGAMWRFRRDTARV
ncbi:putative ABC transporter permease protein [Actinoplanes missouriensis 431]|uniref:Putative ABC transporter permease protein n=1 Tax=Actinoplanes missouriensis (strain ATCC 14538 / DSM 43046 / CBS 188.64 / JCM 3121 / NBRC 102363 / NCIMB 12654 / NRRL B-3342 / UNCC 431) TaxID=512565 RepID=I0H8L1_ACTM4|nr:ABC transporter permease [Actinoplanes missouriensis]BAL89348.1 putative ABC transporter permease protein [Actinoplanes missouriensis 431]